MRLSAAAAALSLAVLTPALAADEWHECLKQRLAQFEDGRSDAGTIASGLLAACRRARVAALSEMQGGSHTATPIERMKMEEVIDAQRPQDLDYVTAFVLAARVQRQH